jgi:MoxR-like ATPase
MENITKKDLMDIVEGTDHPLIESLAKQKMQDEFEGDVVAQKMIQLSQLLSQSQKSSNLDENEVKRIVREEIETDKIKFDDLDETIKRMLTNQPTKVTLTINTGSVTKTIQTTISPSVSTPLVQKILSDLLARNNVYLYGGAGTGKTFLANELADFLGWDLIVVNCNQFTSQLELIGGQTIDGYQEGKVIRAYGNLNADGTPMGRGCILLLDELPKIDPNTAGILNSTLASIGEFDKQGKPRSIQNAKGDKIQRGECFIMATGNSLLNTKDAEYEANFKQDLSLQDRFAGSTYRVFVDQRKEWEQILNQKWAFIFLFLTKLRKAIQEEGFTSKAFVSIRLMLSIQKTYNVFRLMKDKKANPIIQENAEISFTPANVPIALNGVQPSMVKTIQESMDEFFSLFTNEQAEILKEKTDYKGWLNIVKEKNKMPLDQLNTDVELDEINEMLK